MSIIIDGKLYIFLYCNLLSYNDVIVIVIILIQVFTDLIKICKILMALFISLFTEEEFKEKLIRNMKKEVSGRGTYVLD